MKNIFVALLSRKDSNLVKQNQNLLCYHYTTGQSYFTFPKHSTAKINTANVLSDKSCLARIRTLTNRTRICCATITPRDNNIREVEPEGIEPSSKRGMSKLSTCLSYLYFVGHAHSSSLYIGMAYLR